MIMKNGVAKTISGSLNLILRVIARFFRRKNRGNPVLPLGKTNATRRLNGKAKNNFRQPEKQKRHTKKDTVITRVRSTRSNLLTTKNGNAKNFQVA